MNRALLVGINAYPSSPLEGCVNDVTDMAEFLVSNCAFDRDSIRLVTDGRATKAAIVERLGWLLSGLRKGDRVLFHYSGHGAQMPTRNAQGKVDRLDEVICPVDFDWTDAHAIRDKDFNRMFSEVPEGVEFVWVSDSCFSGDLARAFPRLVDGKVARPKTLTPPADINWRLQTAKAKNIKAMGFFHSVDNLNVALISGCRKDQTSADAVFAGRPNGALTYYLLKTLEKNGKISVMKAVEMVRSALSKAGYDQQPQVEGSKDLANVPFLAQGENARAATRGA